MSTVIQVQNLSKRYRIGLKEQRHDTFAQQILATIKAPLQNFRQLRAMSKFGADDESIFWALRDINFEVQQGEVLGIIGHNGAGKSTLLKILSKITEPSAGEVRIKGRIAALLEVGTGFHQDLTGRENIYMNGTILGMSKKEIDRKLDEIIDFSGVEKYVDTPVKFYSSGMKVRLGFAVAAHLEPEILIIDEVLAVGDAEFQKKCLGKMKDVSGQGRTVLFVSHNMAAVTALCDKTLVLKGGNLIYNEETLKAISFYQKSFSENFQPFVEWDEDNSPGDYRAKILKVYIEPITGTYLSINTGVRIVFICKNTLKKSSLDISFNLRNQEEVLMLHYGHTIEEPAKLIPGIYKVGFEIPPFVLNEGEYTLDIWMGLSGVEAVGKKMINAISFYVENDKIDHIVKKLPGVIRPKIALHSQLMEDYDLV